MLELLSGLAYILLFWRTLVGVMVCGLFYGLYTTAFPNASVDAILILCAVFLVACFFRDIYWQWTDKE